MLLAELILAAIKTLLEGTLTATVYRGRVDPVQDSALPAVAIFQGAEEPAGERGRTNIGLMDQFLEVRTEVADRATSATIETELNELRRQVHAALMVENALGLVYVIDIIPDGVDEPVLDGSSDKYTGTMVLNWVVHYRHQHDDAGAAP